MRILHCIFLQVFCILAASAQVDLQQEIDFSARSLPLDKALNKLSSKAAISIAFSDKLIPEDVRVTAKFKQERVQQILDYLLHNTGLAYKVIGDQVVVFKSGEGRRFTISGYIRDATNGERLIGCHIQALGSNKGAVTNAYGFYSLTLPEGMVQVRFSYLGFKPVTRQIDLDGNHRLDLELQPDLFIQEILVIDEDSSNLRTFAIGHLTQQMIRNMPALGGEPDLLRATQMMPGVQTGADGLGGIHVRGGGTDQNLYLLDGVPIYNVSHLAGVFSIYDVDAVRQSQLYKGYVPVRYGGRLSSILDVRTKEGNTKEWKTRAGLGLTSVKGSLEGPLVKNKGAVFLSARQSLIGMAIRPITRNLKADRNEEGFSDYRFYDLNAKVNYSLSAKDQLYWSLYTGRDQYYDESQSAFEDLQGIPPVRFEDRLEQSLSWGNTVSALRWNHLFSAKLFLNTTFTYSRYRFRSDNLGEELIILTDVGGQPDTNRNVSYLRYHSQIEDWAV